MFTRLLDPDAGHFTIAPAGGGTGRQRYVPGTFVLETEFAVPGGALRVRDCLQLEPGARGHEIGRHSPDVLVRVVEAVGADVAVDVRFVPRLEYGLAVPQLERHGATFVTVGGPVRLVLSGGEDLELAEAHAAGRIQLRAGEVRGFAVARVAGMEEPLPTPPDPAAALAATMDGWRSWSEQHDGYDGPFADEVTFAARTVQALTYQRTGAIVAAATTSLPEVPGTDSNWDYRYAWLRDASLTARALLDATCADEALAFFRWMSRAAVTCSGGSHIQIVFGVEGERELVERELTHLAGAGGARPVRVGNAAWEQVQLDAPGEILDVACALGLGPDDIDPFTRDFLRRLVDRALAAVDEPDAGIWERREGDRRHTFSQVMVWVALDRALQLADVIGTAADHGRWRAERDRLHAAVLRRAWNEERGALCGELDGAWLDASLLLLPAVGFLPADDPRMAATAAALVARLGCGDGLLRRTEERLEEPAFLPACFWLAMWQAQAGDPAAARRTVARAAACANEVGLLAEMADPETGAPIGNLPQTLSHVGLIAAAGAIRDAEAVADKKS